MEYLEFLNKLVIGKSMFPKLTDLPVVFMTSPRLYESECRDYGQLYNAYNLEQISGVAYMNTGVTPRFGYVDFVRQPKSELGERLDSLLFLNTIDNSHSVKELLLGLGIADYEVTIEHDTYLTFKSIEDLYNYLTAVYIKGNNRGSVLSYNVVNKVIKQVESEINRTPKWVKDKLKKNKGIEHTVLLDILKALK